MPLRPMNVMVPLSSLGHSPATLGITGSALPAGVTVGMAAGLVSSGMPGVISVPGSGLPAAADGGAAGAVAGVMMGELAAGAAGATAGVAAGSTGLAGAVLAGVVAAGVVMAGPPACAAVVTGRWTMGAASSPPHAVSASKPAANILLDRISVISLALSNTSSVLEPGSCLTSQRRHFDARSLWPQCRLRTIRTKRRN